MQEGESAAVVCLQIDSPTGELYTSLCKYKIGILGFLSTPFFPMCRGYQPKKRSIERRNAWETLAEEIS